MNDEISQLSSEEYRSRMVEQNDIIRRDLALLRGNSPLWRRQRLLEVVCGNCHQPVVEVVRTSTWAAVCFHGTVPDPNRQMVSTVEDRIAELRAGTRKDEIRQGGGQFFPVRIPIEDDALGSWIDALCRCSQHRIGGGKIVSGLRRGERKMRVSSAKL